MLCYDITYVFLFLTLKGLGPCQTFKISIHLGFILVSAYSTW